MASARRIVVRFVAVAIAVIAAALLAEGVASLVFGRSILRGIAGTSPAADPSRMQMFDEERLRAAALSEGPFAADLDPLVGLKPKGSFSYRFHDVVATTDARSLRTHAGPPPGPNAQRIVILGDSVAFGFGVADDETIAHQLEKFLGAATAAPATPPAAYTVACPGWSLQNECRFLADRLDEIKPDVVLLITTVNDLDDSYAVIESGHRSMDCDPARGAGFPVCSLTWHASLGEWQKALFPSAPRIGPYALYSGVTPESRRRYAAAADAIVDLGSRLATSGAKLALVGLSPDPYGIRLVHAVAARHPTLPTFMAFDALSQADSLVGDPHPNARCAKAAAWFLARWVVEQGWIPGTSARALPPQDDRYAERAGRLPDAGELKDLVTNWDRDAGAGIGPRIDFTDGKGWHQAYGGIWPDGAVGNAAWAVLAAGGSKRLSVRVARLPDHRGLHPLSIRVLGNDTLLGTLDLDAPGGGADPVVARAFDLPADLIRSGFLEVRLLPSGWIVEQVRGISRLAAFKVRSLAVE